LSQNNLGRAYQFGLGVPQDNASAVEWYRKSAKQGVALAQLNFGIMYAYGTGVERDPIQAYAWVDLAARTENQHAPGWRDRLASQLDAITLAKAKAVAEKLARNPSQD
ncbi:MAG: tetratricopeptide repeat protein, partial [Candidatus Methylumidiphilus sp.]